MENDQFLFVSVYSHTWLLYVALLLTAVFFRFSRLWSVRNLDLSLTLMLSTALVVEGRARQQIDEQRLTDLTTGAGAHYSSVIYWGSIVVLSLSIVLILRLIFDGSLTRRPRLEQNLNQAGLTFLFLPAFSILMMGVFLKAPPPENLNSVEAGVALLERHESSRPESDDSSTPPPTETILAAGAAKVAELSGQVTASNTNSDQEDSGQEKFLARALVVFAHTCVLIGLMYIGRKHFSSTQLGVSMGCLYLLLPCTAFNVHQLTHVIPAACLTWAFAMYRKPAVSGVLLGAACGTLFFAVFLIPVWAVFYNRKSRLRFGLSLAAAAAVLMLTVALTSESTDSFVNKLVTTANWSVYRLFDSEAPLPDQPMGTVFLRITLAALFLVMLVAMTVIPRKRNLENLLADSTALIVAAQLWYPDDVGSYVLWYLPLLLLVMFRPRLDRFVPPEDPHMTLAKPQEEPAGKSAGTVSRVTLYN